MDDIEGFGYGALRAGDAEVASSGLHFSVATDEHADAGTVDEVQGGQIDDHFAAAVGDETFYGRFGVGEGVAEMEAAGDLDDGDGGCDLAGLEGIRHRVKDITSRVGLTRPVMFLLN
jgi:hypothetical protein